MSVSCLDLSRSLSNYCITSFDKRFQPYSHAFGSPSNGIPLRTNNIPWPITPFSVMANLFVALHPSRKTLIIRDTFDRSNSYVNKRNIGNQLINRTRRCLRCSEKLKSHILMLKSANKF